MPLQTQNLVMIGIGVQGDSPPNGLQPPLVDAVHLRWAFKRELGFPWYGFSLFRRRHQPGRPICLSPMLRDVPLGPTGSSHLATPAGEISSDQQLLLTDDFPASGTPEMDLAGRKYLRLTLPPGGLAYRAEIRVGFRRDQDGAETRECIRFLRRQASPLPNPYREQGVTFSVRDASGALPAQARIGVQNTSSGPLSGLDCGFALEIELPHPSPFVDLHLTHFALPASVQAFNRDGSPAGSATMQNPSGTPEMLRLTGRTIQRVIVTAPKNETLLHEICFGRGERPRPARSQPSITVTALLENQPVGQVVVSGQPGQIATATLEFDAISAIELSSGPAALVDICYVPVSQNATAGWELLHDFSYPLCLPVTHPDYPCSGNAPVDPVAAEGQALSRVVYGPPGDWAGSPFGELHDQLLKLVTGGPGSTPMADRVLPPVTAIPIPPDPGLTPPTMPRQSPLDMVLLGALHPAIAQMTGLYWVDRTAPPGVAFDYLIVADYTGRGGRDPNKLLAVLQSDGFADVEGYIVFNKKQEPAPPLSPPDDPRAYALPGSTRQTQGGGLDDATNTAGLRWNLGTGGGGILLPGRPIMYHVWRAGLGNADTPEAPGSFGLATKAGPRLVAEPHLPPGTAPERASDWPPFPLHYIDSGLSDGWYGYQVSGIDIFGRHSPNSTAAAWYEWTPVPDPRPWYYQDPPGDREIHPSAVRLLDKLPPPPPNAVEATALDPADPTVVKDAAYDSWWASLSPSEQATVIGLRVRWNWTAAHQRQAPDTKEFRIYYQPGRLNARLGRTVSVTISGGTESDVETDIANTHPADAYTGAWLRIGSHSFPVIGSQAGSPLRLRVRNVGLTYTTGTVAVTNGSASVMGAGTWHAGMAGKSFQVTGDAAVYTILSVQSPTELTLNRLYAGATGAGKSYTIFDVRPAVGAPCTLVIPPTYATGMVALTHDSPIVTGTDTGWNANLIGQIFRAEGHLARFTVVVVNSPVQLTLDRASSGPSSTGTAYTISHPLFTDYTASTNWDERYYVVGFNEHVTVTTDAAGRPLRRYDVLLPAPGDTFRGGVPLATSAAEPIVYAQVGVSAAEDKPHTADDPKWTAGRWGNRPGNEGSVGPPATVFRVHREPPPAPEPPPDAERVFATPADYHSRSFYTYRWRPSANLKTHIFRALDDAVFKADWAQRPRPALDASQLQFFPDEAAEPRWNAAKRQQVAAELNQLNGFSHDAAGTMQAMAFYRQLSNDALRVLAGLPGNERAFTQITIQPLDPDDPANANRLGPDNPPGFVIDPALRAFIDTLDGRSTNRYFYRSAYVDGAHNRGPLSRSSPPVWLPNVVPPRTPVLTKALGGDREITLRWTSNREPDLAEYRVYRAKSEEAARDTRLMTLVHTEAVPAGDPMARPAEVTWTDSPVPGRVTFSYRLVAVDEAGNVSNPSQVLAARAFDESRPAPPIWNAPVPGAGNAMTLSWTSPIADLRCLVQRHIAGAATWENASTWLPRGVYTYDDQDRLPGLQYVYRLRVMDTAGRTNNTYNELIV